MFLLITNHKQFVAPDIGKGLFSTRDLLWQVETDLFFCSFVTNTNCQYMRCTKKAGSYGYAKEHWTRNRRKSMKSFAMFFSLLLQNPDFFNNLVDLAFENFAGKGENAGNQHFSLFSQCFLPNTRENSSF